MCRTQRRAGEQRRPGRAGLLAAVLALAIPLLAPPAERAAAASQCLVIYKVYGPGGGSAAVFERSFVELLNRCTAPASLAGLYLKAVNGDATAAVTAPLTGSVGPGRYHLVAYGEPGSGSALPAPDVAVAEPLPVPGKVILTSDSSVTPTCPGGGVIDMVGYGSSSSPCHEGAAPAPAPDSQRAIHRKGCTDGDSNGVDFRRGAFAETTAAENSSVASPLCAGSPSPCLVVNEIYGPGGGTGAAYNRSFVEALNRCSAPVALGDVLLLTIRPDGSGAGVAGQLGAPILGPGRHYLFALGATGAGAPLPPPDRNITFFGLDVPGKVVLTINPDHSTGCPGETGRIDLVGHGVSSSPCFEGAGPASEPNSGESITRTGCSDTNSNPADFHTASPSPKNSASAPVATPCPVPTSVAVAGLTARRTAAGVEISWHLRTAGHILGFNVHRADGDRRLRANRRLLLAAPAGQRSYLFRDRKAPSRRALSYWLEIVGLDGSRAWRGPIRVG